MEEELARRLSDLVRPRRAAIVRAKKEVLRRLAERQPQTLGELLAAVAALEAAEPLATAGQLIVELPEGSSPTDLVGSDHPGVAALRADVIAHEAIAELTAESAHTACICGSRRWRSARGWLTTQMSSPTSRGDRGDPTVCTNRFRRLRASLGLDYVRLHDLRHFVATVLGGLPIATVSSRPGHRDTATTLNIYTHALAATDQQAAVYLGALLADRPAAAP